MKGIQCNELFVGIAPKNKEFLRCDILINRGKRVTVSIEIAKLTEKAIKLGASISEKVGQQPMPPAIPVPIV